MSLYTRLTDLLVTGPAVTGGSHVSHAILLDRSRPSKHFGARARIGLWRSVRDCFSTVSTTVHQSLNAVARGKSGIMLQHGHRSRSLCNRIYYGAGTPIPANAHSVCSVWHSVIAQLSQCTGASERGGAQHLHSSRMACIHSSPISPSLLRISWTRSLACLVAWLRRGVRAIFARLARPPTPGERCCDAHAVANPLQVGERRPPSHERG